MPKRSCVQLLVPVFAGSAWLERSILHVDRPALPAGRPGAAALRAVTGSALNLERSFYHDDVKEAVDLFMSGWA